MTDYAGNSNKNKASANKAKVEGSESKKEDKKIEAVVTGEAIVRKKPIGERIKDTFFGGDAQSVMRYVATEVLLPAVRNLVVDATTKGIERMIYGEDRRTPARPGAYNPRVSYNQPINRGYTADPRRRANLPDQPSLPSAVRGEQIILQSRPECELVLERMGDILSEYEVVSRADLFQLIGLPSNHVDNSWGWTSLLGTHVRQIREGFLLELPPVETL